MTDAAQGPVPRLMDGRGELANLRATQALAERLANLITPPLTIALMGTLGAGKTQFVRYLTAALGVSPANVTSPTYVLLQAYRGRSTIYHLDFYRLDTEAQVWDLGLDELYEQPCLILIEWADKFPQCLPDDYLTIELVQLESERRGLVLRASGPNSARVFNELH